MFKPQYWKKTSFEVRTYHEGLKSELRSFCTQAASEDHKKASINMEVEKLLHIIESEKRFAEGEFLLFQMEGKTVAVSGYHRLDSHPETFLCGVRTYTLSEYENLGIHSNFLLPYQLAKIFQNPNHQALMVFNDYNEKIFHFVESLVVLLKRQTGLDLKLQSLPNKILYKGTSQFGVLLFVDELKTRVFEEMYIYD